jgi:hypothetical protein
VLSHVISPNTTLENIIIQTSSFNTENDKKDTNTNNTNNKNYLKSQLTKYNKSNKLNKSVESKKSDKNNISRVVESINSNYPSNISNNSCRLEIFFYLISTLEKFETTKLEEIMSITTHEEINSCNLNENSRKHIHETWNKFINLTINKPRAGGTSSEITSSTTVDEKKVKSMEKEYSILHDKYNSLNKSVLYLKSSLQSKETYINQLTKFADDLHQIVAQKNRDIKRLKDMFFIEFNNKNNSLVCCSTCPNCGYDVQKCDNSVNHNLDNSNSGALHTESLNCQSINNLTSKSLFEHEYGGYRKECEKKNVYADAFGVDNISYPEKVIVSNRKKLVKPNNIPSLDLAKINDYNVEFINKESLEKQLNNNNDNYNFQEDFKIKKQSSVQIQINHKHNQSLHFTKNNNTELFDNPPQQVKNLNNLNNVKNLKVFNENKNNLFNTKNPIKINKVDSNCSFHEINKLKSLNIKEILNPNKIHINFTSNNTKSNTYNTNSNTNTNSNSNSKNFNFQSNQTTMTMSNLVSQPIQNNKNSKNSQKIKNDFSNNLIVEANLFNNEKKDLDEIKFKQIESRSFHNSISKIKNNQNHNQSELASIKNQSLYIDLKKSYNNCIRTGTVSGVVTEKGLNLNFNDKNDKNIRLDCCDDLKHSDKSSLTKLNFSFNNKNILQHSRNYKSHNNSLSKNQLSVNKNNNTNTNNNNSISSKVDSTTSKINKGMTLLTNEKSLMSIVKKEKADLNNLNNSKYKKISTTEFDMNKKISNSVFKNKCKGK